MAHHPASATPHDEPELSPAERYARARAARHHAGSELGRFAARVGFPLDDFQRRACAEVEDGHGVLVAAPTGAGKTVVGEFADTLLFCSIAADENDVAGLFVLPVNLFQVLVFGLCLRLVR